MSLNHITIMGRLTRDPELRRTGSGIAVASFTIACDRDFSGQDGQKEVDFIDCVAWRQTGEFVAKYFTKGRMAVVDGRLQIRNYEDKNGNKRKVAEIVADHVYFGDSKPEGSSHGGGYNPPPAPATGGYNAQGGNSYGGPMQSYTGRDTSCIDRGEGYQQQSFGGYGGYGGGYSAPVPNERADFGMLEDDDGQLPF